MVALHGAARVSEQGYPDIDSGQVVLTRNKGRLETHQATANPLKKPMRATPAPVLNAPSVVACTVLKPRHDECMNGIGQPKWSTCSSPNKIWQAECLVRGRGPARLLVSHRITAAGRRDDNRKGQRAGVSASDRTSTSDSTVTATRTISGQAERPDYRVTSSTPMSVIVNGDFIEF